ncbi:uncharacterized protein LOC135204895 [Macrobrachium nipponense]|uniref:uncharacterized protein LOC135204895 n=1 Tax=Macrobrachium nipponense TaxID=159736 RepID=UPI0030C8AA01
MTRRSPRISNENTDQRVVGDCDGLSLNNASPVLRRRSAAQASTLPSPVFVRKPALYSRNQKKFGGITKRRLQPALEFGSPVLSRRTRPLHGEKSVVGVNSQWVFSDDSPEAKALLAVKDGEQESLKARPLRERKNVVNGGNVGPKASGRKPSLAPDTMSKENIQPVRKSGRTKKLPARLVLYTLPSKAEPAKGVSTKGKNKTVQSTPCVDMQPGESVCSGSAPVKPVTAQVKKRGRPPKVQNTKESEGPESHPTVQTSVEESIPSEVSVQSQSSENTTVLTPRLSKRETLRQMILNGTLTSQKNSTESEPSESRAEGEKMPEMRLASKSRARKQKSSEPKLPVASAPKAQELTELPLNQNNVRAGRSRRQMDQTASAVATGKAKMSDSTSSKENTGPIEPAGATEMRTKCGSVATKLTSPRTGVVINLEQHDRRSGNSCVVKKKPPIWIAGSGTPADNRRQSVRRKSHLYDFSASPIKKGSKKPKRQYKPRVRTKDTRQKCKLKSVLVTDPEWENPLVVPSGGAKSTSLSSGAGRESVRSVTTTENIFNDEFYAQMNSAISEDYTSDNDVCERDEGSVFEMFEGETVSSFIPSQGMESLTVPMVSVSGHPTPAIRKQIDKHLGSSTPRVETLSFSSPEQPVTVQDDIAQCFGFENDSSDHSSLNLSPVRQSGQQSQLHLTFNSEMTTSINHSNSQPYRFSWGVLRPGNHSYSSSRSSSMVVHGRSTNASASLSSASVGSHQNVTHPLQSGKHGTTTAKVKAQGRQKLALQRSLRGNPQVRGKAAIASSSSSSQDGNHNISALFDEEDEEDENVESCAPVNEVAPVQRSSADIRSYLSANLRRVSPEKSATKRSRKSYDRKALLEAKKKFEKEYGGAATTEAETEEDVSVQKEPPKRKKKVTRKKVAKKQKVASNDETTEGSQISEAAVAGKPRTKKHVGPKKKKENRLERSIQDWASSLNSHFSEIEDSELVVF